MRKTYSRLAVTIMIISILLFPFSQISAASKEDRTDENIVIEKVRSVLPDSIQMTDRAINVLSAGLNGLSSQEREIFEKYFDPGNTGKIDENYTAGVLENFRKIRGRISREITLIYETSSNRCELMTLYYTDFVRIHVCPYAAQETNLLRMARGMVHEAAHMAFLAFDRSYYYPNYSVYEALQPKTNPATRIPLIGYIIREVLRNDTLYNADTYAKFAAEVYSKAADYEIQEVSAVEEVLMEETFSPEVRYSDAGR